MTYKNSYRNHRHDPSFYFMGYATSNITHYSITPSGPLDTCTYTSGNWNVNCADNCTISSNVASSNAVSNISIIGTGKFIMYANISGFTKYHISGNCRVACHGGCFRD